MSLAYATPAGRYGFAGFGLVQPPVRLPSALNVPAQWSAHPHLSGFILGALAMYALPPFIGGMFQGAGDEIREQVARRNRIYRKAEDARARRLAMRSRR